MRQKKALWCSGYKRPTRRLIMHAARVRFRAWSIFHTAKYTRISWDHCRSANDWVYVVSNIDFIQVRWQLYVEIKMKHCWFPSTQTHIRVSPICESATVFSNIPRSDAKTCRMTWATTRQKTQYYCVDFKALIKLAQQINPARWRKWQFWFIRLATWYFQKW